MIRYIENKGQYGISGRDFYEKTFQFIENGKFYKYSSSIDSSELPVPEGVPNPNENDQVVRAFTIHAVTLI